MRTTPVRNTRVSTGSYRAARRLIAAVAVGPAIASLAIEAPVPPVTRALIAVLWMLSLYPFYRYFGQRSGQRRPLPFFPAVSAMYGLYYALPLTLGITDQYYNAPVDPRTDYDFPVQLAFFGWILMVAGYHVSGIFIKERKRVESVSWRPAVLARWGLIFLFGGILVSVLRTWFEGLYIRGGVYQFVVSLQWFGAGLLTALARRRELPTAGKVFAFIGIALSAMMMLAIGSLAPLVMMIGVVGFGLWIGKPVIQKKWLIGAVFVLLAAVSFRGVALDFRFQAWFNSSQLSQSERVMLMLKLLKTRIETTGVAATVGHGLITTAGRSATLDLFANTVRRTPSEVPYWNGRTYLSLIGAFVPRFLWPDKPTKELGQAFGHRYGYLYWTNTSTAINLPVLVEFFINFSVLGVMAGMFIVGIIYRALDVGVNRPGQSPLISMMGAVLLLPLLMIESDFSLLFGGIPLNAIAFAIVYWMLVKLPTVAPTSSRSRATPVIHVDAIPAVVQPRLGDGRDPGRVALESN